MFEKQLTYDDLDITDKELFVQMGYGDNMPGDDVIKELESVRREIRVFLRPRFCFILLDDARLDVDRRQLAVGDKVFDIGRIIAAQLRGSEAFALFAATSGVDFERYQRRLEQQGDMVRVFIADAFGSVIAEKTADVMERWLQIYINSRGWLHTNRFSPGYCGWHVSQQQMLFSEFGVDEPCGIKLTDSSLMIPIKSVSGLIGLGKHVRKLEYTCGLCDYAKCYKRRKPSRKHG